MGLDPTDDNVKRAVFGKQVEKFLSSDLGRYILQCADSEVERHYVSLGTVEPTDCNRIVLLQSRIKMLESMKQWLAEAVHAGQQSLQTLEESHAEGA